MQEPLENSKRSFKHSYLRAKDGPDILDVGFNLALLSETQKAHIKGMRGTPGSQPLPIGTPYSWYNPASQFYIQGLLLLQGVHFLFVTRCKRSQ